MNPALRGKPIAVVPMLTDSTCVIAASYPAKRFGIRTGTRVGDAKQMCPGLLLITGRHEHYIRFHHKILAAIDTVLPSKVRSIDEMECRLWGQEREPANAIALARRIKAVIQGQVGDQLTSSIGIAPNQKLAKVGSDMQKPDGLIVLGGSEESLAAMHERLRGLVLRDMPGIGPRMEKRLRTAGIQSMADLIGRSEKELVSAFGSIHGAYWWHWLRGREVTETEMHTRSIGHQHVLPPEERTPVAARAVLVRLLHKAAARLRKGDYVANGLHVFVRCVQEGAGGRWGGKAGWERVVNLGIPTDDTVNLVRAFAAIWEEAEGDPNGFMGKRLLMVGVTLINLQPTGAVTPSLFADHIAEHRPGRTLGNVMDKVNAKFGKAAIYPASMQSAKGSAPPRIAFSSIPDLDLPE